MIFRKLDDQGDWTFGKGLSNYSRDEEAVDLNIRTRLLSWRNDCFFDMNAGVDYKNLLDKGTKSLLDLAVRTVILSSYGVTALNGVPNINLGSNRKISMQYNIDTIFGNNFKNKVNA